MGKEITVIYRIRNKRTGEFVTGGHSAGKGMFTRLQSAIASFRVREEGRTLNWETRAKACAKDYEIVEYVVSEWDTHPIPDRGSSNE